MQCNLPILKRRLDLPTCNILEDILCRSSLCMLGVDNSTTLIDLDNVRKNRISLLKRTRFVEDARIVNTLKQGMPDAPIRNPE